MAKKTKKNNNEKMMERNHTMMHHGMKAKGIIYLIVGLIFVYFAYTWSPVVISAIIALGIGVWLVSVGAMKFGWNCWGMAGCGCGCGCCGDCTCEWEEK